MGWFSRNPTDPDTGRRSGGRSAPSGEAQLRELRVRARRRLVGALALVIVAVIFVPMLFDSSPPQEELPVPVVVPAIEAPNLAQGSEHQVAMGTDAGSGTLQASPANENDTVQPGATTPPSGTDARPAEQGFAPSESAPEAPSTPPAASAQTSTPKPEPTRPPAREPAPRTDDGSVALALLEGRAPVAAPSSNQGSFTLQIAAYTTEADARGRRDKLVASGVTNAYVESATVEGKPTYRLRVGPFPTRDAAQAAQARLRALGYDNGFISSQ